VGRVQKFLETSGGGGGGVCRSPSLLKMSGVGGGGTVAVAANPPRCSKRVEVVVRLRVQKSQMSGDGGEGRTPSLLESVGS